MEPNIQDLAGGDGVSVHTGFPNQTTLQAVIAA